MKLFGEVICRGQLGDEDTAMWFAAIIEPSDCGEKASTTEDVAPERKLRPIAQTEALVKFIEIALVEDCKARLKQALEPRQRGVTVPDGPVQTVKLLRGWV